MHSLKITQIGNPPGVVLPKDALARYRLTTVNPECEARMTLARGIMKTRHPVPAELAG